MKKRILLKTMPLLCALVVGSSNVWGQTLTVDFEESLDTYTDWDFTDLTLTSSETGGKITTDPHGGSYFAKTTKSSGSWAVTKNKISKPVSLTCYYTKCSSNTNNSSLFKIQVSEDGSEWIDAQSGNTMNNVTQATWYELTADLSTYSNVYVRVYYKGTSAIRGLDDIVLTYSVPVTSVTVEPTSYNVAVGGNFDVTATVAPSNATNKAITWSIIDESQDGILSLSSTTAATTTVTANKEGTAKVKVTTTDGSFTATCDVTVVSASSPHADVSTTELDFERVLAGSNKQLTFTVTPANLTGNLTITCENGKYTVSPTEIAQSVTEATTITVTAAPTAFNDDMDGTITISGGGITEQNVTLSTTPYVAVEGTLVGTKGTFSSSDVEISENSFTSETGLTATITATPNSGYKFTGWTAVGATPATSDNAEETFTFTAADVTLTATFEEAETYVTVTDASTLKAGDQLLIVCGSSNVALGAIHSGTKYYTGASVTISDSQILDPENVAVLTLGGSEGAWTLQSSIDNYYLQGSNSNELRQSETATEDTEKWTIDISYGTALITNKNYTDRTIKWNSGNPRFACYTSGQQSLQLYRLVKQTTITTADYSTFVPSIKVAVPDDVKAYTVSATTSETATLSPITVIPANTPVILYKNVDENTVLTFTATNAESDMVGENKLQYSSTNVTANGTQYILAQNESIVGFYKASSGSTIAAGKAYLVSPAGARFLSFDFGGETTGINALYVKREMENVYNLNGQRVAQPTKGLYIMNGKKVVIK